MQRRARADPAWKPAEHHDDADDAEMVEVHQPGQEALRQRAVGYKRLSRERLRCVTEEEGAITKWICIIPGLRQVEREIVALASTSVHRAVRAAVEEYEKEQRGLEAEAQKARARQAQRDRREREREEVLASRRTVAPRLSRVFSKDTELPQPFELRELKMESKSDGSASKQPKPDRKLSSEHVRSLERIATSKELRRADVIGADKMSLSEWADVKADAKVMRKVQALNHFAQLCLDGYEYYVRGFMYINIRIIVYI